MKSVTVLMTCHNRKRKTKECICSLYDGAFKMRYIVVDDGSSDGTREMLEELQQKYPLTVLEGDGTLFWGGGMRKAMEEALGEQDGSDYYILVNDDVEFSQEALRSAFRQLGNRKDTVLVGTMCNKDKKLTYGGIQFQGKGIRYETVTAEKEQECDTFNCNFVLLPAKIFRKAGNFDIHFQHAMADFDYGLHIRKMGYKIVNSVYYLGVCERNSKEGSWMDTDISRKERLHKKESAKGLPAGEWFYYLKKNFGLRSAVWHSITPYLKIALKK